MYTALVKTRQNYRGGEKHFVLTNESENQLLAAVMQYHYQHLGSDQGVEWALIADEDGTVVKRCIRETYQLTDDKDGPTIDNVSIFPVFVAKEVG